MRKRFIFHALLAAASAALAGAAAAEGLDLRDTASPWSTRLELGSRSGDGPRTVTLRLFSDYYLDRPRLGDEGGLRLTSGLLMGQRNAVLEPLAASRLSAGGLMLGQAGGTGTLSGDNAADDLRAWPYIGVGYTGISARGGWGFTADLGLTAQNLGALRLGSQSLDEALRELRLRPVLQLGVSYRF